MREWYVIRLGRPEANKPHWVPTGEQGAQAAPLPQNWGNLELNVAPRADRRQPRPIPVEQEFQPALQPARPTGYGYHVKQASPGDQSGTIVFTSLEAAEGYAKEQAALNPKTMFGIFSCEKIFETTEPTIVTKSYNESGELIIQKEAANV